MVNSINQFFKQRFDLWLKRRIPAKFDHHLSSKNIFIFPTKFGFSYLFFVLLLFLLGTNYQNNIIILFSYLLASLFITVMLHSFYNFSQLIISSKAKQSGFAEQEINFPIQVQANKSHYDLTFCFTDKTITSKLVQLTSNSKGVSTINLPVICDCRGKYNLGRVRVASEYSLGLFRSWTVLDFAHQAIIYPKIKNLPSAQYRLSGLLDDDVENFTPSYSPGIDEFSELKSYIPGESLSRTAWKQLAKGQGHFSKHYQAQQGGLQWLKLSDMPNADIETRLSYLSFLICEFTRSKQEFGLLLDEMQSETVIKPSSGVAHQQSCLTALALY